MSDFSVKKATLRCEAGLIARVGVRILLDRAVIELDDFEYRETRGWLSSHFTMRGTPREIADIKRLLRQMHEKLEASDVSP